MLETKSASWQDAEATLLCKRLASGLSLAMKQVKWKHAVRGAVDCMLVDERPP